MIMFVREASLSQLLRRLGLEKYSEVFHKNEIDMQLFLTMTDKELKEVRKYNRCCAACLTDFAVQWLRVVAIK